jgi:hypothetical protein
MKLSFQLSIGFFSLFLTWQQIFAFCGFYVARADATLYNKASKVILAKDNEKNVITMMNDYQGKLKDFALVVPVPVVLQKDQINVADNKPIDHLDAYTAPRLVEYFDENPCKRIYYEDEVTKSSAPTSTSEKRPNRQKDLGVTIEASYTVGEYDILILSAKDSGGLEEWLIKNQYKIPTGASKALEPYIKQKMKFFVAKVNLKEHSKANLTYLRPLQFAFDSPKFMLPIRLGMLNAKGDQDLLVFVLSRKGRVETTNYRTIKLPSDIEVPSFVKGEFKDFYLAMFQNQVKKENGKAVFTEYFWDMSWCDPCAAEPLSNQELKALGVMWLDNNNFPANAPNVLVTRLHLRYNSETFPEDLVFQETSDRANFQGRYIIRHPWTGNPNECSEAKTYFQNLEKSQEQRAKNLAMLTGWDIESIRQKMNLKNNPNNTEEKWWKKLWEK